MAMPRDLKIGIVGSGPVGAGLATLLADQGHSVLASSRNPTSGGRDGVPIGTFEAAAAHGELVFLAIAHHAVEAVVLELKPHLDGKVVVDVTNAVDVQDGRIVSGLGAGQTEGSWMASLLTDSRVVRAFSHIQDEMLVSRARRQPGRWAVAIAGDDNDAVTLVAELSQAIGYVPVVIGGLAASQPLDPGGVLFPHMFLPNDLRDVLERAGLARP
jgi:predicted dinucleotide-binding enzyme